MSWRRSFLNFFLIFFLAGREGISSRVSQPEGVYFYERAAEYLATACLPLDQGVIQGVWGGHEEVWGWSGEGISLGCWEGELEGVGGYWLMSTHHRMGLAKYLEVLGHAQLPVDLG